MNFDDALWNELNGIFLADEATDAAVNAYNAGDLTELGRIIATHINQQMASRSMRLAAYDTRLSDADRVAAIKNDDRFDLTKIGLDQANAARFLGGVL